MNKRTNELTDMLTNIKSTLNLGELEKINKEIQKEEDDEMKSMKARYYKLVCHGLFDKLL